MANVHLLISSFNAGELSPLMGARFGVEKVASGCRLMRNFLPHVSGPAFRRPGAEYMGANLGNGAASNLRPFNFSTSTAFVLEFHPNGLGVWSNGAAVPLLNPVPLPYAAQECFELQMTQVNDVCYIVHPNHPPQQLTRVTDENWTLAEVAWTWPAMGDENTPSTAIDAPVESEIFSANTEGWPEFHSTDGVEISAVDPILSTDTKTMRLGVWDGAEFAIQKTVTWTTVLPAPVEVPLSGNHICILAYGNEGHRLPLIAGGSLNASWTAGTFSLPLDSAQPVSRQPFTVPAGKWQVSVSTSVPLSAGAGLVIEKQTGSTFTTYKTLALHGNSVTSYPMPKLAVDTTFRLVWQGVTMTGGTMRVDSIGEPPAASTVTIAVDGTSGDNHTMTASSPLFQAGHVGSYWQLRYYRPTASIQIVCAVPTIAAATTSALAVAGNWNLFSYGTWTATIYLEQMVGDQWVTMQSWTGNSDRNIIANGTQEEETQLRLRITAGTSTASDTAAAPRFVLEATDPSVFGLVQVTAVGTLNTNGFATTATVNVIAPLWSTAATIFWTEGSWSAVRGYPRTIALHQGRLWFGGTNVEPTRLWGSVINDFLNFTQQNPTADDASVSFIPAAATTNPMMWLASYGIALMFGTAGDEWTIAGGTTNGPITPSSVQVQRRSQHGSAFQPAALIGDAAVFVARGGSKVRQISTPDYGIQWSAVDVTVLAEHLTKPGIVQMAVMTFPWSILWAVTTDGKLLGMTFEQEQNVFGWHCHETNGLFESVAVIYGGVSDEVWVCVNRNGARSIERLDPQVFARQFNTPASLIYLDCASRVIFETPTATVTGLDRFEGQQVSILGDGAEYPTATVIGGAVTLSQPVSTAIVGLPFVSRLQPMRMDIPMRDGTAQGRRWRVSRVHLMLHDSLGGQVSSAPDAQFETLQYRRASTPMDGPPPLFSGELEVPVSSNARGGADVIVRTNAPLPLNVGAIVVKGDVYGE